MASIAALLWLQVPALAAPPPTPLPGQIVVTIDPPKDLVATRQGWTSFVDVPSPRGTTGCLQRTLKQHEPLAFVPFTARDIARAAQRAGKLESRRTRVGIIQYVRMASGKVATISQYVAELNDMEKFLNIFGRSLHEEAADLGVVAKLRDAKLSEGCRLEVVKYKPIWRDPRVPIDQLIDGWRLQDEVPGWMTSAADMRGSPTELLTPAQKRRIAVRGTGDGMPDGLAIAALRNRRALFGVSAQDVSSGINGTGSNSRIALFRSTQPLAMQPTSTFALLRRGQRIRFVTPGQPPATMILKGDCPITIDGGTATEPAKGVGMPTGSGGSSPGTTEKGGEYEVTTKGEPTACLSQGSFEQRFTPWDSCITTGGSFNNWFGGSACVTIAAQNSGKEGSLSFENSVGIGAVATVFGHDINLLRGDAVARSSTSGGASAPPAVVSGLVKDLSGSGSCCAPIAGPSMYIPIAGPTGLQVSTALTLNLDVTNLAGKAAPAPTGCTVGVIPVVSVTGNATASAGVNFEAAISAVIAQAGIGGSLTLVGGDLSGRITTTADMGANLVTVTPSMRFVSDIGSGEVYAFVEVDLFVVTKKWKLTLADWQGSNKVTDLTREPGTVRATRPETQEAICAAPSG